MIYSLAYIVPFPSRLYDQLKFDDSAEKAKNIGPDLMD